MNLIDEICKMPIAVFKSVREVSSEDAVRTDT